MLIVGFLNDVGKLVLLLLQLLVGTSELIVELLLIVHFLLGLVRVLLGNGQFVLSGSKRGILGFDLILELRNLMGCDLKLALKLGNLILSFDQVL